MTTLSTNRGSRRGFANPSITNLSFTELFASSSGRARRVRHFLAAAACLLLVLGALSAPAHAQKDPLAYDANGRELPARFGLHGERRPAADDAGAKHPLLETFAQLAELTPSNGTDSQNFGNSVTLSANGNTALVGAPNLYVSGNVHQGGAYVFTFANGSWTQTQLLTAPDGVAEDLFGASVALSADGTIALVGAPAHSVVGVYEGAVYVFTLASGSWAQTQELSPSDGATSDGFGWSVAMSGDTTALVGSVNHAVSGKSFQGAAYVFKNSGASWNQMQELISSDGAAGDSFGASVALSADGTTALVGASEHFVSGNSSDLGAAYVFTFASGSWTQTQELTGFGGLFGQSVALAGDTTALVGAPNQTVNVPSGQGGALLFTWTSGSVSSSQLTSSDGAASDLFGSSVALSADGTAALVGAPYHAVSGHSEQGAAYVFSNSGGNSTQAQELTASDGAAGNEFGWFVALAGGGTAPLTALLGEPRHGDNEGAAYVSSTGTAQTITFGAISNQQYGSSPFTVSATANSGLTVTLTSQTQAVCSVSGTTVTLVAAGSCTIQATQSGNSEYFAAPPVSQSFEVTQEYQAVSFTMPPPASAGYGSSFAVAATGGGSGNPVIITSSGACSGGGTGNSATITMNSPTGTCTVTATQAGNSDYQTGVAQQNVTATKGASGLTWSTPSPITYGTTLSGVLNATASVPGTFAYKSGSTAETASKILAAGSYTLTVTFKPTSTADYNGGTASVPLTVNQAPTTTTFTSTNPTITLSASGTASTTVDFKVSSYKPTGTGLLATSGPGSVTCTPASCKGTVSSATGKGSVKLAFTTAGTYTVNATYQPDANHTGSTTASPLTVTVNPH